MRVLAIPGSLRADSVNRRLLAAASSELPGGVELDVYDGLRDLPPFDEDAEEPPPASVAALREAVIAADAVILATPEYNASIPGVLKNALDWASRPHGASSFKGRPAAVVGASVTLFGAVWAQAELRKVLGNMGAEVLDRELPVGQATEAFGADGRLKDPDLQRRLADIVGELVAAVDGSVGAGADSADSVGVAV